MKHRQYPEPPRRRRRRLLLLLVVALLVAGGTVGLIYVTADTDASPPPSPSPAPSTTPSSTCAPGPDAGPEGLAGCEMQSCRTARPVELTIDGRGVPVEAGFGLYMAPGSEYGITPLGRIASVPGPDDALDDCVAVPSDPELPAPQLPVPLCEDLAGEVRNEGGVHAGVLTAEGPTLKAMVIDPFGEAAGLPVVLVAPLHGGVLIGDEEVDLPLLVTLPAYQLASQGCGQASG